MSTDILDRLREADVASATPEPSFDDIVLRIRADREPHRSNTAARARRIARPVLVAGTVAVIATAGVALAPSTDGPSGVPGILQRAAAAVSRPDTILHYRAVVQTASKNTTIESWQSTDGRRDHTIIDDGALEFARDVDAKTYRTYSRAQNTVVDHSDPASFIVIAPFARDLSGGASSLASSQVGDVNELLRQARDGTGDVSLVGRTEIRGIAVDQVRVIRRVSTDTGVLVPEGPDGKANTTLRDVYLRADNGLPVRLIDHDVIYTDGGATTSDRVTDFLEAEQLPDDAATGRLLQLQDHPGARQTTETSGD